MAGIRHREVRRLGYLREICNLITRTKIKELSLAASLLLESAKKLNDKLINYKRTTGGFTTHNVAMSYIFVAVDLGLIKSSGIFIEPSPFSAFFASLPGNPNTFELTSEEKISFLEILLDKKEDNIRNLIKVLSPEIFYDIKQIKDEFRKNDPELSEDACDRITKSHSEWLIDLNLIVSSRKTHGAFRYNQILDKNLELKNLLEISPYDREVRENIVKTYSEFILNKKIKKVSKVNTKTMQSVFDNAKKETREYARSELDRTLLSALPIILSVRLKLIKDHGLLIRTEEIIKILEDLLPQKGISFKWDYIYGGGNIKL